MKKTGQIKDYIEIPVTVDYSAHPEEPMTLTYPGCHAHVTVDFYNYPDESEIDKLIGKEADAIKEACMEDANQPPDDGI